MNWRSHSCSKLPYTIKFDKKIPDCRDVKAVHQMNLSQYQGASLLRSGDQTNGADGGHCSGKLNSYPSILFSLLFNTLYPNRANLPGSCYMGATTGLQVGARKFHQSDLTTSSWWFY